MPAIGKLMQKREKRLELAEFTGDDGYITILRLTPRDIRKIRYLSIDSMDNQIGKQIIKKMQLEELTNDDLEELKEDKKKAMDLLNDIDFDATHIKQMDNIANDLEDFCLEHGVHKTKHNYFDSDKAGNAVQVSLTSENMYKYFDPDTIDYIVSEIRKFSRGFSLGK